LDWPLNSYIDFVLTFFAFWVADVLQGLHAATTEPLIMQGLRFLQGLLLAGVAVTLVRTVADKLKRTNN
jgi:hypothetical protein